MIAPVQRWAGVVWREGGPADDVPLCVSAAVSYDRYRTDGCDFFGRRQSSDCPFTGWGTGKLVISISGADGLHKIVVMNPKGGCGKTTLATNLAGWFALRGPPPTLVDCDPQGFCARWLERRAAHRPKVHGRVAGPLTARSTIEAHADSSVVIIDLPAAITDDQLHSLVYLADSLLLPVVPSEIDVHSATRFIAELLLDAQLDRSERRVGIVANRVRGRTRSFAMLQRFLGSLRIPLIAALRDSQNFVQAAAVGLGVCELSPHRAHDDLPALAAIGQWLDRRRAVSRAQREALIAQAAYRYAEARGFVGGDPTADWLRAEEEVDRAGIVGLTAGHAV
jgi:chromosome partitioning protein